MKAGSTAALALPGLVLLGWRAWANWGQVDPGLWPALHREALGSLVWTVLVAPLTMMSGDPLPLAVMLGTAFAGLGVVLAVFGAAAREFEPWQVALVGLVMGGLGAVAATAGGEVGAALALAGAGYWLLDARGTRAAAPVLVLAVLTVLRPPTGGPGRVYASAVRRGEADLGKWLTRNTQPGDKVAGPVAGPLPLYAPDLTWVGPADAPDFIVAAKGDKPPDGYKQVAYWNASAGRLLVFRSTSAPAPERVVVDTIPKGLGPSIELGGQVVFEGALVSPTAPAGGAIVVDSWLSPERRVGSDVLTHVQVRRQGRRAKPNRTMSHRPGDRLWAGDDWTGGELVRDRTVFYIDEDWPPGTYEVLWRLFDDGRERPLGARGLDDGWVLAGTVQLTARDDALVWVEPTDLDWERAPAPEASPDWPPPELRDGPVLAFSGDLNLGRRQPSISASKGMADALGRLTPLVEADLAAVNVESVVSGGGESGVDKGEDCPYYYRGRPETLGVLVEAGVDVAFMGNNHLGDYGPAAVVDELELLDAANIAHAGGGQNFDEACAPTFRRVGDVNVAFFSLDATMDYFAATESKAGSCYLDPSDVDGWKRHFEPRVAEARERADLVMVGVHWGRNNRDLPSSDTIAAAKAMIDAGVDAILGSSAHRLHGIGEYKGRPIIYDGGNLLFDSHGLGEGQYGAVFELVLDKRGVTQVRAIPIELHYGYTDLADGNTASSILNRLRTLSTQVGTEPKVRDGLVVVDFEPPAAERTTPPLPPNPEVGPSPEPLQEPPDVCTVAELPDDVIVPTEPIQMGPLRLEGYKIVNPHIVGRSLAWVDTYWTVEQRPEDDYFLYERLTADASTKGKMWWGDHEPCDWAWPTSRMEPGVIYRDHYGIRAPHPLPPGGYDVRLGLTLDNAHVADVVELGKVTVVPRPK